MATLGWIIVQLGFPQSSGRIRGRGAILAHRLPRNAQTEPHLVCETILTQ